MIYKLIGRGVVALVALFIKRRARRLEVGAGVAVVAFGIGLYIATRNVEEG